MPASTHSQRHWPRSGSPHMLRRTSQGSVKQRPVKRVCRGRQFLLIYQHSQEDVVMLLFIASVAEAQQENKAEQQKHNNLHHTWLATKLYNMLLHFPGLSPAQNSKEEPNTRVTQRTPPSSPSRSSSKRQTANEDPEAQVFGLLGFA